MTPGNIRRGLVKTADTFVFNEYTHVAVRGLPFGNGNDNDVRGTGSEHAMDQEMRRDILRRYIRTAMTRDSRLSRYIAISWPVDDAESATEVAINGRMPGEIVLSVRSAAITNEGAQHLTDAGFAAQYDERNPRYRVFQRSAARAAIENLVDFAEWVFLVVLGAPSDYTPTVIPAGSSESGKAKPGCGKSCLTVMKVAFWIMLGVIVLLTWVLR